MTNDTLKNLLKKTEELLAYKYGKRKRLTQEEVWEKATTLRDIQELRDKMKKTDF